MLPQIGSSELLLIAIVALIVVGPKDLPILLRKVGKFIARLRGMANDFRTSFDDMARQSELEDLRREVAAMRDAATAESNALNQHVAQLSEEVHGAHMTPLSIETTPPQAEPFDPDPEAYRYAQETPAEKIIKRRARVAAAEAAEAKPARKPHGAAAKADEAAAPQSAAPKAKAARKPKGQS